jgi:hypothetical protein
MVLASVLNAKASPLEVLSKEGHGDAWTVTGSLCGRVAAEVGRPIRRYWDMYRIHHQWA